MTPIVARSIIWDKKNKGEISASDAIKLVQKLEDYSIEYDGFKKLEHQDVHFAHAKIIAKTLGVPETYCKQNYSYFNQSSLMEHLRDFINMVSVKNRQGKTIYIEDILGFNKYCPLELQEIDGTQQLVYAHHATGKQYTTWFKNGPDYRIDFGFYIRKCKNPTIIKIDKNNIETLKMLLDYLKNIQDTNVNVFSAYCSTDNQCTKLVEVRDYLVTATAITKYRYYLAPKQTTTTDIN